MYFQRAIDEQTRIQKGNVKTWSFNFGTSNPMGVHRPREVRNGDLVETYTLGSFRPQLVYRTLCRSIAMGGRSPHRDQSESGPGP